MEIDHLKNLIELKKSHDELLKACRRAIFIMGTSGMKMNYPESYDFVNNTIVDSEIINERIRQILSGI